MTTWISCISRCSCSTFCCSFGIFPSSVSSNVYNWRILDLFCFLCELSQRHTQPVMLRTHSLRFISHFPGAPGKPAAEYFLCGFYWELRVMTVVVITGKSSTPTYQHPVSVFHRPNQQCQSTERILTDNCSSSWCLCTKQQIIINHHLHPNATSRNYPEPDM